MPLLRTETLFGIKCSIYDNGTVIAGTSSDRITLRLNANEELVPKLRAALIKRGFRTADELPEDASAAAAMAPQPLQPQSLPESETEDEQPAAEATVLFGSKPCKQLRPQRSGENECAQLASTLGKAWEMGQPASRAEGELREITRANGVVWREQLEARQATVKRRREETAAHTEQCLCTREGAITMLKQSMKLNHQLNEQADELLKIAKIPISAPSEPAVAQ